MVPTARGQSSTGGLLRSGIPRRLDPSPGEEKSECQKAKRKRTNAHRTFTLWTSAHKLANHDLVNMVSVAPLPSLLSANHLSIPAF